MSVLPILTIHIYPIEVGIVSPVEIADEVCDEDDIDWQRREVLYQQPALVFLPLKVVVLAHKLCGAPEHRCHKKCFKQVKTNHEYHAPLVVKFGKEARHKEEGHTDHKIEHDEEAEDLLIASVVYYTFLVIFLSTNVQTAPAATGILGDVIVIVDNFGYIPVLLGLHNIPHDSPLANLQVVDAEDEDEDDTVEDVE